MGWGTGKDNGVYKWVDIPTESTLFINSQFRVYRANYYFCGVAHHSGKVPYTIFDMCFKSICLPLFRSSVITNFSLN